ncbi:hypothetical protein SAMN05421493_104130 [Pseudobutyrivibrio sp. 49]|uniref:hypothetical protein n=1 Tax=Pseudobutyrivibrio sp. 49 TaxID=1855344 RepID=UPI000887888E|nr:hypothetical protein [Pseudobutyrivibrio sp. 49]SDH82551.1 hypothetical protein SAMN05421493_104130 [Pseudobutyrivibrio sp. 49]
MKIFMIGGTGLLGSEAAVLPPEMKKEEGAEKLGVQPDDIEGAIADSMKLCKDIMDKKVNSISMRGE